jgi:hypothetical protein
MLRLLSDEDVPGDIVRGLRRRQPELDVVRVQEVDLRGTRDRDVLAFAAAEGRQVFTRDRNSMTADAYDRVARGLPMPGVFVLPEHISLGKAVTELELLAFASDPDDWKDRVIFLPL